MSKSPDLSFICLDTAFEPLADTVAKALKGHPSLSTGAQLRLGVQLTLGALAAVNPTLRRQLSEALAPAVFGTAQVGPDGVRPGRLAKPRAPAARQIDRHVDGMVRH